uniref:Lectin n=1 Tax=Kalanchoe fedtschenkoi TaxID=63787 RepID=A0A7N0ZYZ1_KALFE
MHRRRDEEEQDRGRPPPSVHHVSHHHTPLHPPPPYEFMNEAPPLRQPAPPSVHHVSHHTPLHPPPPPPYEFMNEAPPLRQPEYTTVQHISHNPQQQHADSPAGTHFFTPHMPSFLHHHSHNNTLANHPTCRVFSKAHPGLSLALVDSKVVFATANPSDPLQHWHKDEKYSTQVKDQDGFPSFSLVNKATGQAIKHSVGAGYPVQLTTYNSNTLDESVLWTLGKDLGDGFRTIRMINNIHLNFDALNADKKHGGVHEGTIIGLGEWKKADNERLQWKIAPY